MRGLERVVVLRSEVVSARREDVMKADMVVELASSLMVVKLSGRRYVIRFEVFGLGLGIRCEDIETKPTKEEQLSHVLLDVLVLDRGSGMLHGRRSYGVIDRE